MDGTKLFLCGRRVRK